MAVPTLKMAPPVVAPNMKPAIDTLSADFAKAFSAAQNFGRMNPQVVQEALANGGSLSNSLGFNSSQDVMGLSPSELMTLAQGGGVNQNLQQAGQSFEMITGGKENREGKRALAQQLFQGGMRGVELGANNQIQVDSANAGRQQSGYNSQFSADVQMEEGRQTRAQQKAMHDERLALEASRQVYLNQIAKSAAAGQANNAGTNADEGLALRLDQQLKQYGGISDDGRLTLESVPLGQRRAALQTYMQREAAKGLPYNQRYAVPKEYQADLGGYERLVLGRDGWHGVYSSKKPGENTKWHATPNPVVPFRQAPPKGAGSGSSGGAYQAYPTYDQQ